MSPIFTATVLQRHEVKYYFCESSGLIQTESPYWLDEAYQDAIASTDVGLVHRNVSNRDALLPLLELLFQGEGKFLDVGGGYGMLARLLRDSGFDCYTFDKYCQNLFAKAFEPGDNFKADALFAFEVFEHVEDPCAFVTEMFSQYGCRTIFFSTETFEEPIPTHDWWYYSFETGQHIAFYQTRTLTLLAEKLGCSYHRLGHLHLISDRPLPSMAKAILSNSFLYRLYRRKAWRKRRQMGGIWNDHRLMKERLKRELDKRKNEGSPG